MNLGLQEPQIGVLLADHAPGRHIICAVVPTVLKARQTATLADVGVDYFTRWVEAEPLASITEKQVQSFTWKSIITRFGILRAIIIDNGAQFNNTKFKAYCQSYAIQLRFSSTVHPQTNSQSKVMNRVILEGLKKRVSGMCGAWVDELPSILWVMRMTPKTASRDSPFSLAFGTEALLPPEMVFPTLHTTIYEQNNYEEGLRVNLDLLKEKRVEAHPCTLAYKRL
uniref:Integrase catalytic domain-containing protein n=1 Tax=Musa acuminata subsp. malaccensis TaxID=214687 RepID=A0A804JI19_MUSAM